MRARIPAAQSGNNTEALVPSHSMNGEADSQREFNVIQVTDTHLLANTSDSLKGHDTDRSLQAVIRSISERGIPIDLVLATGDLCHDGLPATYARLKTHLRRLVAPVHCLPGNHDDPAAMADILAGKTVSCSSTVRLGDWHIILLDSVIPGEDGGRLSSEQLARLNTALANVGRGHALVCLHHHPVPVGCKGMDTIGLENRDDFFSVIDRHNCVRGIVWGHIHNEYEAERKGVRLLGTPATCFQFNFDSDTITIDDRPPAYRSLALTPRGAIKTDILHVPLS